MSIIFLVLEILHRAALILGVILILDIAHNGKISIAHKKLKLKKNSMIYKLFMKIADKLESGLEARKRAWEFRAR